MGQISHVEGEDLEQILSRVGPLREGTALAWIRQILDALAYIHPPQVESAILCLVSLDPAVRERPECGRGGGDRDPKTCHANGRGGFQTRPYNLARCGNREDCGRRAEALCAGARIHDEKYRSGDQRRDSAVEKGLPWLFERLDQCEIASAQSHS